MRRKLGNVGLVLVIAGCAPAYGWSGPADNKPVPALELMTDEELCVEARDVCLKTFAQRSIGKIMTGVEGRLARDGLKAPGVEDHAQQNLATASAGVSYVETVALVARKMHKGTRPEWAQKLLNDVGSDLDNSCLVRCRPTDPPEFR